MQDLRSNVKFLSACLSVPPQHMALTGARSCPEDSSLHAEVSSHILTCAEEALEPQSSTLAATHAQSSQSRTAAATSSVTATSSGCLVDAGLMLGHSCRVGWAPNGSLFIPGRSAHQQATRVSAVPTCFKHCWAINVCGELRNVHTENQLGGKSLYFRISMLPL